MACESLSLQAVQSQIEGHQIQSKVLGSQQRSATHHSRHPWGTMCSYVTVLADLCSLACRAELAANGSPECRGSLSFAMDISNARHGSTNTLSG